MSRSKRKLYVVAYDISDPKRLQRVHRLLKNRAISIQKSVFIALLSKPECDELIEALKALIAEKADDVRIYPLPPNPHWYAWGEALWPDGMTITGTELPKHYH